MQEGKSPVTAIEKACGQAVSQQGKTAARWIVGALSEGAGSGFRQSGDPRLHLVTVLTRNPVFLQELTARALQAPEVYRGSLVPGVLTEAHLAGGRILEAEKLRQSFGQGEALAVWSQVVDAQVRSLVASGKAREAKRLMIETYPVAANPLWFAVLHQLKDVPEERAFVARSVKQALGGENPPADPGALAGWLELGAHCEEWQSVWTAVEKADAHGKVSLSEKLEVQLFGAFASGEVESKGSLRDVRLRAVVATGKAFADGASLKGVFWPSKHKSPLAKDTRYLQALDRRKSAALKERPDAVAEISAWVPFLGSASSELKKRSWVAPSFRERGMELLGGFCRDAASRLGKLPVSPKVAVEEWKSVVASLHSRLGECLIFTGGKKRSEVLSE